MSALADALLLLRCPHCAAPLSGGDEAVRCAAGHSFDVARQGYLSLLEGAGSAHSGDTAEMVAARDRFLGAGHFEPLAAELAAAVAGASPIVDLGAGTGWYLGRVLGAGGDDDALGLALDLSKPALRRAARAHPRVAAVACDVWGPFPLRDGVAGAVLNVFAPRNVGEIARVLGRDGVAAVVTPTPGHLRELAQPLGLLGVGERKQLGAELAVADRRELTWTMTLDRPAARDLAAMGPSAFHVDAGELHERVAALPQSIDVTAAVTITLATAAAPRARPPAPAASASGAGRRRSRPASRSRRSPGGTG